MEVCSPVALNCDTCIGLTLQYAASMKVSAGLTPATTPYLWITDKFGKQYKNQVTIAGDGSFNIVLINYPTGLFQSIGYFDLFLSSDSSGSVIIPIPISIVPYNCIKLLISC